MRIIRQLVFFSVAISIVGCSGKKEKNIAVKAPTVKSEPAKISNAWRSFNVSTLKVDSNGIGKFNIGHVFPSQFAPLKRQERKIVKNTEGGTESAVVDVITSEGKTLFMVNKNATKSIEEITVYSPEIKTSSGIGVGSTISQLLATYPDAKVWYTNVSDQVVLESPSLSNIQFVLDKKGYKTESISYSSDIEHLNTSDFKTDTSIKSIRVF